jgi:transcription initiation factor TFIIIB Brf1 subunit/transcription initiation factor TFIIB
MTIEETIWGDFEKSIHPDENICCIEDHCKHCTVIYDTKQGNSYCTDCGEILNNRVIDNDCEWNTYKNDYGQFENTNQRSDTYISDNPYEKGGSIPGFNKKSFIMRLHYQQVFDNKQKSYWKVSELFTSYCTLLGVNLSVLADAKKMWHVCMESGKLTRASVRSGLIGSCFYYSCILNNIPIEREILIREIEGNNKGFLKGEKIFHEIMEHTEYYKKLGKIRIDIKENDSFVKFCSTLELPFNVSNKCNEIYEQNKDKLDSVTPKSCIAGIIFYVVKNDIDLKTPSKSKISKVVDVCIPTINKVMAILES